MLITFSCNSFPFGMLMPGRHENSAQYRYSFQGQEKDDEIKGQGNSINYKYRMHDPRIGRFFARDPLAGDYPHNSPYAFSENRVIDGIELEGLEVVVLFGGGDLPGNGSTGTAKEIAETVADKAKGGTSVVLVNSNYHKPVQVIMAAVEEIMNNRKPGEPIVIYGYSKGGEYAILLAKQLQTMGVDVDLLITVDAADGPFTFMLNREIPDNVKKNINYYQDKGSLIFSEGDPNTAKDDSKTVIDNIDLTGNTFKDEEGNEVPFIHGTMDEGTKEDAETDIVKEVNGG